MEKEKIKKVLKIVELQDKRIKLLTVQNKKLQEGQKDKDVDYDAKIKELEKDIETSNDKIKEKDKEIDLIMNKEGKEQTSDEFLNEIKTLLKT